MIHILFCVTQQTVVHTWRRSFASQSSQLSHYAPAAWWTWSNPSQMPGLQAAVRRLVIRGQHSHSHYVSAASLLTDIQWIMLTSWHLRFTKNKRLTYAYAANICSCSEIDTLSLQDSKATIKGGYMLHNFIPSLWKEVASRWTRSSSRLRMQWQRWWGRSCGRGLDAVGRCRGCLPWCITCSSRVMTCSTPFLCRWTTVDLCFHH